ncbi:Curromycin resistance protein [Frankliniella fusca]|uniref:Curromycin resistance protein n=1 Tax=Frankliniella fusca TaxID=407009 RepID=A0AAE1HRR7_9NEOP|nr:Curromycin resistance protein [Frankliniella fusca]
MRRRTQHYCLDSTDGSEDKSRLEPTPTTPVSESPTLTARTGEGAGEMSPEHRLAQAGAPTVRPQRERRPPRWTYDYVLGIVTNDSAVDINFLQESTLLDEDLELLDEPILEARPPPPLPGSDAESTLAKLSRERRLWGLTPQTAVCNFHVIYLHLILFPFSSAMVRNKGSKLSPSKKKRKNQKKSLKRKYCSSSKQTLQSQSRNQRRQNNKEKLVNEACQEIYDERDYDGSNIRRISDRKYVENNVKVLRNQLLSNSSGEDVVDLFGKKLESLSWHVCSVCHTKQMQFSQKCWCSKPYVVNSRLLSVGFCPDVLSDLSLIEQLLIARIHPVVQVYRLVGGQTGYSGHVINFFQDVKAVAKVLPHTIPDLKGVVHVCYNKLMFHKDFKIRKQKVMDALIFLKNNNKYYHDIVIDAQSLEALPCDDFFHGNKEDMEHVEHAFYLIYIHIFVPDVAGEDEIVSAAVPLPSFYHSEDKVKHNMNWPEISCNAVKELTRPYIAQAFPSLFPYGEGDLHEVRDKKLSPRIYFQYLMEFEDGRFSNHKIFPYFGLNTVMRWECLSKGTVYMKDHPNLKKMNIEVLKDIIKKNPDFMKDILLVLDNPKICSDYFYEIFTMFFESIVLGSFEVLDYWYRFEWQMRGSPHVHGVMWLQNAVDVNLLEAKFEEVKITVIQYFDKLISCESPNLNYIDVGFHPCSVKIADISSVEDDVAALINTVQMHVCSKKCIKNENSS